MVWAMRGPGRRLEVSDQVDLTDGAFPDAADSRLESLARIRRDLIGQ